MPTCFSIGLISLEVLPALVCICQGAVDGNGGGGGSLLGGGGGGAARREVGGGGTGIAKACMLANDWRAVASNKNKVQTSNLSLES